MHINAFKKEIDFKLKFEIICLKNYIVLNQLPNGYIVRCKLSLKEMRNIILCQ